ncbi:MAG: Ca-activated chloride channel family protein [Bacteroidia bacterium]|jgi:Ca-activated chloride channel family protein
MVILGYKQYMRHVILMCFAVLLSLKGVSQTSQPQTRILFLFDASFSMTNKMGRDDSRMKVAKKLLGRMVDSLEKIDGLEIALRVYGHQYTTKDYNCTDTKLEVGFKPNNHGEIKTRLNEIKPSGTTLIAYSLEQAAYDFPTNGSSRNIVILITDGIEECNGDPCAVSQALQKQGVLLKPFIIGVGLNADFRKQFDCVGKYFEATTEQEFERVLDVVVSQALSNTTVTVNLNNTAGLPLETNVNMSFYDAHSGVFISNYVHTINRFGFPDTLFIDPIHDYDIIVHTIPPLVKKNVSMPAGKHTTVDFDAPQGNLELNIGGVSGYKNLQALIYKPGTKEIIHVQSFNTKEPYITGKYDIEILSLPRVFKNDIPIVQSKKTNLRIPQPGSVNLITKTRYWGDIYQIKGDIHVWVCNIDLDGNSQNITMQPGNYAIELRGKTDANIENSKEELFIISSGKVTNIKI